MGPQAQRHRVSLSSSALISASFLSLHLLRCDPSKPSTCSRGSLHSRLRLLRTAATHPILPTMRSLFVKALIHSCLFPSSRRRLVCLPTPDTPLLPLWQPSLPPNLSTNSHLSPTLLQQQTRLLGPTPSARMSRGPSYPRIKTSQSGKLKSRQN